MQNAPHHPTLDLVEAAISGQRGLLEYQPILRPTGRLVFQEALLRLITPDGEVVYPARFLPFAEEVGRVAEIDVIALSLATSLMERASTLRLSVNLHPAGLTSIRLRAALAAIPQRIMDRLILEVTEYTAVCPRGMETLRDARRAGAAIFLDDFGAGAQSLALVREGICDGIKLDKGLIDGVAASPEKRAIARAIIQMGDELDLMVVAEGVERQAEADWLIQNGVHALQGFLVGRPARQAHSLRLAAVG